MMSFTEPNARFSFRLTDYVCKAKGMCLSDKRVWLRGGECYLCDDRFSITIDLISVLRNPPSLSAHYQHALCSFSIFIVVSVHFCVESFSIVYTISVCVVRHGLFGLYS